MISLDSTRHHVLAPILGSELTFSKEVYIIACRLKDC